MSETTLFLLVATPFVALCLAALYNGMFGDLLEWIGKPPLTLGKLGVLALAFALSFGVCSYLSR